MESLQLQENRLVTWFYDTNFAKLPVLTKRQLSNNDNVIQSEILQFDMKLRCVP